MTTGFKPTTPKGEIMTTEIVAKLAAAYPLTFFVLADSRPPLKIGVFRDLVAAGVSKTFSKKALGLYCSSMGYLASMIEGTARIDLNGDETGAVTADEAAKAAEVVKAHDEQWVEALAHYRQKATSPTREKRRPIVVEAPPPPPPKPARISLDGLRTAARARQLATVT
jgi:sRNA-binding protein